MAHDDLPPPADLPPADAADALDRHLARALALPPERVVRWYGVPSLVADNVRRGTATVLAERASLTAQLPNADWQRMEEAPELATAAWHAFALADRAVATPERPHGEHRAAVSSHRTRLMAAAEFLATQGAVAAAEVAAIRHGSGQRDQGEDVLALVDLLQQAGTAASALVPAEKLAQARAEATSFLARLRPAGRKGDTGKKGEAAEAADLRDRVFTLVLQAYGEVWRVGAWRWGHEVEAHVPGLNARRV